MGELYGIPCSSSSSVVCATSSRKCTFCNRDSSECESIGEKVTELPLEACQRSCGTPEHRQGGQGTDRPALALIGQLPAVREVGRVSAHQARGHDKGRLGATVPGIDLA